MQSLKSNIEELGETVTQIITSTTGVKKTIRGIKTKTIVQNEFTRFDTEDGRRIMVKDDNVFLIEVFNEKK